MAWTRPKDSKHPGGDHSPECYIWEWEDSASVKKDIVQSGKKSSSTECHPNCPVFVAKTATLRATFRTFRDGKEVKK